MDLHTNDVWSKELIISKNVIRQLLVPFGDLSIEDSGNFLFNNTGKWPVSKPTSLEVGKFAAILPNGETGEIEVEWQGNLQRSDPESVLKSYEKLDGFFNTAFESTRLQEFRRPQLGALYSILGYWKSGVNDPALVVMPTGTGKTETMLAVFVTERPEHLLVIVPTATLRNQIAEKFERLGILQTKGILSSESLRPVVGRLEHTIKEKQDAISFVKDTNVIVATPQIFSHLSNEIYEIIVGFCTHLIIDEAHHSAANTWNRILSSFKNKRTLLFTATPFREDDKRLPGRIVFRFPLNEARKDGYFTDIRYNTVSTLGNTDKNLATKAIAQIREDIGNGFDHILMARAASIPRCKEIFEIYQRLGADFNPAIIHNKISSSARAEILKNLKEGQCRIILCVNMLGEGFDLPSLKIAAIHDLKKGLGPMIQLIGRFTRSQPDGSKATFFIPRDPRNIYSPIRPLVQEDPDWNILLHEITENTTRVVEEREEFEASFPYETGDIPVSVLQPKMSAIAYRSASGFWDPERVLERYNPDDLVDRQIFRGSENSIAWFIVQHLDKIRWGSVAVLEQRTFELIVMYFDDENRILFINSSTNAGNYSDLAAKVLDDQFVPIRGPETFRVLSGEGRLIPTNAGLLDIRNQSKKFSMHVGTDIREVLEARGRETKTQTHIAAKGYSNGERVTISAAHSGRFWSLRSANGLLDWKKWCDEQGSKLIDDTIRTQDILSSLILPEPLEKRPPYSLITLNWPWRFYTGTIREPIFVFEDEQSPLTDIEILINSNDIAGPFFFTFVISNFQIPYRAEVVNYRVVYSPIDSDADIIDENGTKRPLSEWINDSSNKPTLYLSGDITIESNDYIYRVKDLPPYKKEKLKILSWKGVDITKESQRISRRPDSIQAFIASYLKKEKNFSVLLDDDRSYEAADLVGIEENRYRVEVTLVHCKFSSKPTPGARLDDLYDVCGQAQRSAKWRHGQMFPLFDHLRKRIKKIVEDNQDIGYDPFEIGDFEKFTDIHERIDKKDLSLHVIVVQPGLSASQISDDQLQLLAGVENYIKDVAQGSLEVFCSP